jgi:virulence factor Mce-like protein
MSRGRGAASVVASPVLVGAVTVLIVVVAVFLAYNANQGLPFVPTYNLSAELPNGSNLVPGNDVRVGGFRVGIVDSMRPKVVTVGHKRLSIAVVDMHLDKTVEPLARDSTLIVRARSALGLKYVEIDPGTSKQTYAPGSTIPLRFASLPVEFDDFLNTFDEPTRIANQQALTGYGDAFAGRGADLNEAIAAFNPFFDFLQPVMANLANPATTLDQFFRQIGETVRQVAPVAAENAQNFFNMATTFAALNRCPTCLQDTISKNPPTEQTAINSFRVQQPFLRDFTDLSRRLIPAAQVLPTALPPFNLALKIGTPVQRQSVTLSLNTRDLFNSLDVLAKDPNTLLALEDLRDTFGVTRPLISYVAPYQTVCNDTDYFFSGLSSHQSEQTSQGYIEKILFKSDSNSPQANKFGGFAFRPADIPANMNVHSNDPVEKSTALEAAHGVAYPPAVDAQGNANCQIGQYGYTQFPPPSPFKPRYKPANVTPTNNPVQLETELQNFQNTKGGGSHVVGPGQDEVYNELAGPTYTGVPNLKDVP